MGARAVCAVVEGLAPAGRQDDDPVERVRLRRTRFFCVLLGMVRAAQRWWSAWFRRRPAHDPRRLQLRRYGDGNLSVLAAARRRLFLCGWRLCDRRTLCRRGVALTSAFVRYGVGLWL